MNAAAAEHHQHRVIITAVIAAVIGIALGAVVAALIVSRLSGGEQMQGGGAMGGGMPPAQVRVGNVEQQDLRARFDVVGRLHELRRAVVASEVEGRVLDVPIEPGDMVVGGETVLAEIDGVWSNLALKESQAQVAAAKATLEQSRRDYEYLKTLQTNGSAKPKEVDDAATMVAANEATLEAAHAALDLAQQRVDRLKVVAPFDGAVVDRLVERGQWVDPGTPVAQVITTGQLDAEVYVPEQHIGEVAVGEPIDVTVGPLNERVTGAVVAIVPTASNAARTFPVKVRLDDMGGRLKAGMSVVAHLPVSKAGPKLTVPRDAVLFDGDNAMVWVAAEIVEPKQHVAQPVPVKVTFGVADRYAVEPLGATLEPGAMVVVQGGERLMPNQPLMIDPGPQAAQAPQVPSATP